jgi:hypothetical protein
MSFLPIELFSFMSELTSEELLRRFATVAGDSATPAWSSPTKAWVISGAVTGRSFRIRLRTGGFMGISYELAGEVREHGGGSSVYARLRPRWSSVINSVAWLVTMLGGSVVFIREYGGSMHRIMVWLAPLLALLAYAMQLTLFSSAKSCAKELLDQVSM